MNLEQVFLIILFVLLIYLVFVTAGKLNDMINDRNRRRFIENYQHIHGDANDEIAQNVINYGERLEAKTALEHYILGTTYLLNAQQPQNAVRHFQQAVQVIQAGHQGNDWDIENFVLERVHDFNDLFVDFPDIDDIPIQEALLTHYNTRPTPTRTEEDPRTSLAGRQKWVSDSQNVHDSGIIDSFKNQYQIVKKENSLLKNRSQLTYGSFKKWLADRYSSSPKYQDMQKVIDFIDNNYYVPAIDDHEKSIVENVWARSYDPANSDNQAKIQEALAYAILDCVEGNHVVCITGRSQKVWQALATLDKDPHMGVFKSKQAVKNEIFDRCRNIIDQHIESGISQELKQDYLANKETEQVEELKDHIRAEIDKLRKEYENELDAIQLNAAIEDCKAVV